jgi:hypothetical protein
MAVRTAKSGTDRLNRTTSVFPRETTPEAAVVLPERTSSAPTMSFVYRTAGDVTPGACVRLIARANALARTGVPSLKRNPLRRVNVHVFASRDTVGGRAATSGSSPSPAGGALSGFASSRAQVVSSSAHTGTDNESAGSM